MSRTRSTLGTVVGYHGCSLETAKKIFSGEEHLQPSKNDNDWLGHGIYSWVDSYERALDWAEASRERNGWKEVAVVGAYIHTGLCLNLTDYGVNDSLISAYTLLEESARKTKTPLPSNTRNKHGIYLMRNLDCAVINIVHQLRHDAGLDGYDTVYGVFEEGDELFPGSGFREKSHVQLAVRTTSSIIGYFRPNGLNFN